MVEISGGTSVCLDDKKLLWMGRKESLFRRIAGYWEGFTLRSKIFVVATGVAKGWRLMRIAAILRVAGLAGVAALLGGVWGDADCAVADDQAGGDQRQGLRRAAAYRECNDPALYGWDERGWGGVESSADANGDDGRERELQHHWLV